MTSLSNIVPLTGEERASFGVARVQMLAFEAVHNLWKRRRAEGKSQADLAQTLNKDEGWLSKNLRGPGNWTLKTLGEMTEALDGDIEITIHAMEDPLPDRTNYHAYCGYECAPNGMLTLQGIPLGNSPIGSAINIRLPSYPTVLVPST